MSDMIERELKRIANLAYGKVNPVIGNREIVGKAADGDVYFKLDEIAEQTVKRACRNSPLKLAYFSEGTEKLEYLTSSPDFIIISDEIDGTRAAKSGFENCCITMALAPYMENPHVGDIEYAFIKEIVTGVEYYAEKGKGVKIRFGDKETKPQPTRTTSLGNTSLSIELWGSPLIVSYITEPIVRESLPTGVFHINSTAWSHCQMARGRLDGHFHLAKRIYNEFPELRSTIAPNGKLKALFPYDIAPVLLMDNECGIITTDSYGKSLDDTSLLDISPQNQRCLIAASTRELHSQMKNTINKRISELHKPENIEFLKMALK